MYGTCSRGDNQGRAVQNFRARLSAENGERARQDPCGPQRMAAPFVPLASQRPVRLIKLGIGKSNRTLVPIGKDYQVGCSLRHAPLHTQADTGALCRHAGDRSILEQRQR